MEEMKIIETRSVEVDDLGKDRSLIHEAVMAGCKVGAGRDFWTKLAHDEDLFRRVVELVEKSNAVESPISTPPVITYEPTPSQIRAREIMGRNFLGIEEMTKHYKISPTLEQLETLAEIPFSEEMIEEHKYKYLLVAGSPITIVDMRAKTLLKKPKIFYSNEDASWYNIQGFANTEKVGLNWYFIRKTAIRDSFDKKFTDQIGFLGLNEEVPRACELVYAVVLYFLSTGERLFGDVYARCIDLTSDGTGPRISVGNFTLSGIIIKSYWGDKDYDYVGLASCLKS